MYAIARSLLLLATLMSVAHADTSRRLFDFTPVAPDNPVVAKIDGAIEIPLSELRGYRDAERPKFIADPTNLALKRAMLEDLINEYLLVDEACRDGVPSTPGFMRQMEATRTMLLTDFMSARAAGQRMLAPAEKSDAGAALAEKLFEAASIEVSNEACDVLKKAAKEVDDVRPPTSTAAERLYALIDATPDPVLVRYEGKTISVRQILALYAGLTADKRPPVQTPDGLIAMIKPLILPELMAIEATRRGIEAEPEFQNKIVQNRNALLRFHAQGQVERQANALLRAPNQDVQLLTWFEQHKSDYAVIDADGRRRQATYLEARAQVAGDYSVALRDRLLAEKARELRQVHKVWIDEAALKSL